MLNRLRLTIKSYIFWFVFAAYKCEQRLLFKMKVIWASVRTPIKYYALYYRLRRKGYGASKCLRCLSRYERITCIKLKKRIRELQLTNYKAAQDLAEDIGVSTPDILTLVGYYDNDKKE
jgi:hypothetical protein